ncbi:hypothetical protein [Arthrobacter woluwensis]|uniref:hypothetical protein n=1 Tax=Arthrobacter woluwensis TaxID=156980 RepID=UPI0038175417
MSSREVWEAKIASLWGLTPSGRPNLSGCAEAAGVSVSTVRRWLRGEGSWERLESLLAGTGEPVWTRALLAHALKIKFGTTASGRLPVPAVAHALNVSPRTVRRWFVGHRDVHLPEGRLQEVLASFQPDAKQLRMEDEARAYAVDGALELRVPRKRRMSTVAWERDGWLGPHFLSVVRVRRAPQVVRPVISIPSDAALRRLSRAGLVEDTRQCANRLEAMALKMELLERMRPWRIKLGREHLEQGGTECWLLQAPRPMLAELGVEELQPKSA